MEVFIFVVSLFLICDEALPLLSDFEFAMQAI